MQARRSAASARVETACRALQTEGYSTARFEGPLDCVKKTFQREGIRGLYKGATPPLVGWTMIDSTMWYGRMSALFQNRRHEQPMTI